MPDLSVVIIANNEEKYLPRCLRSVLQVTHDIILVDSGSTDATPKIAQEMGAKVYFKPFTGYGAGKNFGAEKAKFDWILSIDGDEELSPDLIGSINRLVPETGNVYALNSLVCYAGKWIKHSGWYPRYKNRLYNRHEIHWNDALVHEDLEPLYNKKIVKLAGDLWHYSYDSLEDHRKKAEYYGRLKAEEWIRRKNYPSLLKQVFSPIFAFIRTYLLKGGFLDGKAGFYIARYTAWQYLWAILHFRKINKKE